MRSDADAEAPRQDRGQAAHAARRVLVVAAVSALAVTAQSSIDSPANANQGPYAANGYTATVLGGRLVHRTAAPEETA